MGFSTPKIKVPTIPPIPPAANPPTLAASPSVIAQVTGNKATQAIGEGLPGLIKTSGQGVQTPSNLAIPTLLGS